MKRVSLLIALAALGFAEIRRIDPPAASDSGMASLTKGPNGTVYLSWTDTIGPKEHALRFSRWTGSAWAEPETIARGTNWFANWADFPALTILPDSSMFAHWLTRTDGGSSYGYGIRVAQKQAGTAPWREIHGMSLGNPSDYAGFLSFAPGEATALFLAPPGQHDSAVAGQEHGHRKTVRQIVFDKQGKVKDEGEVDADACSCCPTTIGRTPRGLIAAYRDHQPGEIRDIAVIRQVDGVWTKPRTLHDDGWKINGCPTDGPSLATAGSQVAIAWLTRAGEAPKVQVTLSSDNGEHFSQPIRLDSGNPLGRPSIVAAGSSEFFVVWLEKLDANQNELRIKRIQGNGVTSEPLVVARVPIGRAAGFPKLAVTGEQILVAWRDQKVRTALLTTTQLKTEK
ncbi:hypothetical protein [Bryobacter aggregatus]|uniref:hypothetical protein n=1 Tax=Bryobacter aggregatus TaxID=360054 RepID=UPI0004E1A8D9|nr:hypothetical protein [Bryobacter aggregatus]